MLDQIHVGFREPIHQNHGQPIVILRRWKDLRVYTGAGFLVLHDVTQGIASCFVRLLRRTTNV